MTGRSKNMRHGFTLLEVLITMMILIIGLLPIFALFPLGHQRTAEVMRDTYAAIIVQLVQGALEVGITRLRVTLDSGERGFVFLGDGVETLLQEQAKTLPRDLTYDDGSPPSVDTSAAYWIRLPAPGEKFLYPRFDPSRYALEGYVKTTSPTGAPVDDLTHPMTKKVFPLGWKLRKLAEGVDPDDPTRSVSDKEKKEAENDPYSSYGYAFLIEEAMIDTNGDGTPDSYSPLHNIFEVTVFIYRNFGALNELFLSGQDAQAFQHRNHKPVRYFKFLISY
ncbi:MAG: type II secretion system GspH family protein [Planctomycetota bacterium]|nr:type II secretion system GspH family protein [Planctomycetota bacterium]